MKFYTQGLTDVYSAGLEAKGLHLLAQSVMAEDGLDISKHTSDLVRKWEGTQFDYLISVCGELDESILELFPNSKYIAWNFIDPDEAESSRLQTFRAVREEIKSSIIKFIGEELPQSLKLLASA